MKKLLLSSLLMFLFTNCTDLGEPTIHPSDWIGTNSENSHVSKIIVSGNETCRTCHGDDYFGGTSEVSCYQCHAGGPSGHPAYNIWVSSSDNTESHGKNNADRCVSCHGDDYFGGTSGVSCYQCHAGGPKSGHPATSIWVGSPDDPDFHGKDNLERCVSCHGDDYFGGTSGVSCYQCHAGGPSGHPSYDIWVDSPNDSNFHGKDDIDRCVSCHGEDYLGGTSGVSCYQCHNGPEGYDCPNYNPPGSHSELQDNNNCEALHPPGFNNPIDNGCTSCHGGDLTGGWGPSCFICHSNRWDD